VDFDHEHRQVPQAVRQLKGPLHCGNPYPAWCLHSMSFLLTTMVHYHDDKFLRSFKVVERKRQIISSTYSNPIGSS
jgi:hypothetical protein